MPWTSPPVFATGPFFTFGDAPHLLHKIGDTGCEPCWTNYPRPCKCGGLVHAHYGDEDDEGFWLDRSCDRCRLDWETVDGMI